MGRKPFRSQPILSRSFTADRRAPGAARQVVDEVCSGIPSDLRDDIRLLVSEVVTNSVIHGSPEADAEVELDVWATGDAVRVAVKDSGPGFEPPQAPRRPEYSGWGLMMVDQLADRWGVDLDGHTEVWFELRRARVAA
jgi:anti-sigma regulatory factor (Ser/Thr protein kinase)